MTPATIGGMLIIAFMWYYYPDSSILHVDPLASSHAEIEECGTPNVQDLTPFIQKSVTWEGEDTNPFVSFKVAAGASDLFVSSLYQVSHV